MFRTTVAKRIFNSAPRRSGHGHAAPTEGVNTLPKWIQQMEAAPRAQVIAGSLVASLVISGFAWSIMMSGGINNIRINN